MGVFHPFLLQLKPRGISGREAELLIRFVAQTVLVLVN